jgi:hypothetical protein
MNPAFPPPGRSDARAHIDNLRMTTRPPAPPRSTVPTQLAEHAQMRRDALRDSIDHHRKLGLLVPVIPSELETLLNRLDELETAQAAARFLDQMPTAAERYRIVCAPGYDVVHTNQYLNGTAVVTIKRVP